MKSRRVWLMVLVCALILVGCSGGGSSSGSSVSDPENSDPENPAPLVVNSLDDAADPPPGTVTLRSALAEAASGEPIVFDQSLNGGVIELSLVGEEHTLLKGEVMGMREEPSGLVSYLEGYFDRDYGKSALYARKNVVIDASALPDGITISWANDTESARVLAIYGDLTMTNVTITGGKSFAENIATENLDDQPWTLARGGGLAVWGRAVLDRCIIHDNHCEGDFDPSRDRGAFGGGLYANIVEMTDCIVSGNTVLGAGAAGGGVFSVGGAGVPDRASIVSRSSIVGNCISGIFAYGGGVYSDGGGIGNRKALELDNCTIARNVAEPPIGSPEAPAPSWGMGYWRGGGVYMSNGYLKMNSCTVVENEVYGVPRTDDLDKRNLAGGVAATVGNAHAVEEMLIGSSIIAGNTVNELSGDGTAVTGTYDHDVFTGSLMHFKSRGFNLFGVVDFSQILVPVGIPNWESLSRRHYPKLEDQEGIIVSEVLDTANPVTGAENILSAGVGDREPAVLYYQPRESALDRLPGDAWAVEDVYAEYEVRNDGQDNFLEIILDRIESHFSLPGFAEAFQQDFEAELNSFGDQPYTDPKGNPILTLADTQMFGPAETWPKRLANYPYILFWHRLDQALQAEELPEVGSELLGDKSWQAIFETGPLAENSNIIMWIDTKTLLVSPPAVDQLGRQRGADNPADIGAVEALDTL